MNEYEMMTILHPRLNADETAAAVTAVEGMIGANGGELLSTDVWGRRRLAYPINHLNDGTYVLNTFKMPAEGTAPLERALRISESVLRHMLIRGIIPFEGGRDEPRDDRDDRDGDRDDRRRDDDRPDDRGDERGSEAAAPTSEVAEASAADEPSAEAPAADGAADDESQA